MTGFLLRWAISALGLWLADQVLDGVSFDSTEALAAAALCAPALADTVTARFPRDAHDRANVFTRMFPDLPLFAAAPTRPASGTAKAVESEVEKALASVNPDELSPKQALELLYELRRKLP